LVQAQTPDDPIRRYGALPIPRSGHFHLTRDPRRSRKAHPTTNVVTPTVGRLCVPPDAMPPPANAGTPPTGRPVPPMRPTPNQSSLLETALAAPRQGAQRNKTRRMTTP